MKITLHAIDNTIIKKLIENSDKQIAVTNSNTAGVVAYVDDCIAGFSMMLIDNHHRAVIKVLRVYDKYRRLGVGRRILAEIVKYAKRDNLSLVAEFNNRNYDVEVAKSFFVNQGYSKIQLDVLEYIVSAEDCKNLFINNIERQKFFPCKLYAELECSEKKQIGELCKNISNNIFHPENYTELYNNHHSVYITDKNNDIYGWSIIDIVRDELVIYSIYLKPECRRMGVWLDLIQHILNKTCVNTIKHINFNISADNTPVINLHNKLFKHIEPYIINHYITTII